MDAIHIRTYGLCNDECAARVEMAVGNLKGVAAVVAVKSMKITSVLFYEDTISPRSILRAIRGAGFDARLMRHELAASAA